MIGVASQIIVVPAGTPHTFAMIGSERLDMIDIHILNRDELPRDGNTYEFEGSQYQDTEVSFIWVDMPLGGVIRLHKHPYKRIFIIQEGVATDTADEVRETTHFFG